MNGITKLRPGGGEGGGCCIGGSNSNWPNNDGISDSTRPVFDPCWKPGI